MPPSFYRFRLTGFYLTHLFKSATRQDHASLTTIIRRYLPIDGVAIDIGAHGGQVTRLLADAAPDGLVVAVEPSGYARSILRLALFLRGYKNIVIAAMALGATAGTTLIRTPLKRRGDMGYGLANLVDAGSNFVAEPVAVATLDSLVASLNLSRLDFIKADIEGFEDEMIKGATGVLQKMRPAIYMEMDDGWLRRANSSLEMLWTRMTDHGYVPYQTSTQIAGSLRTIATPCAGDILWLPSETADLQR
jgi:FkbM family methyltransferase